MRGLKHVAVMLAVVGVTLGMATAEDLLWLTGTEAANAIRDASGIPLDASENDPFTGDFLQLVYTPSGTISPAAIHLISPTGVTGDNQVVATGFFGMGTDVFFLDTLDGLMQDLQIVSNADQVSAIGRLFADGDSLFVRAWTEPASDYDAGEISTSDPLFYGNSPLFVFNTTSSGTGVEFRFDTYSGETEPITGWVADLRPIPEPVTGWLVLIGLGLLSRLRAGRATRR